jgi:S-(hydroxymethyl)glutathione dehydrogenase/alcohol dehydrogenase
VKAAILVEVGQPLVVANIALPKLEVGQVLVKVAYSGICGKQLDEIAGKRPDPFLPHLLGHEGAGVVVEIGPGVRKVQPGNHVVLHWMKGPGIESNPPRFQWDGKALSAGWVTTFSDMTVASENRVTVIPDDVPLSVAPLLGCAVTTGLGIVFNNAALSPGQSMAVFGVGGVGLNVIQGAALANAYPIVALDLLDSKLERAREFGATHVFNSANGDAGALLMDLSGGRGFDATVDTTGLPVIIQTAYAATSNSGKTILAGVPRADARITIDSYPLHGGKKIFGSHGGDTRPEVDIARYVQLYKLGKLKLDELVTHSYPLESVNQAVELVQHGEAGRCFLSMN